MHIFGSFARDLIVLRLFSLFVLWRCRSRRLNFSNRWNLKVAFNSWQGVRQKYGVNSSVGTDSSTVFLTAFIAIVLTAKSRL